MRHEGLMTRKSVISLARSFRETGYKPDFAGLVRFFYGRAKDTGLDWKMWKPRAKPVLWTR